MGYSNNIGVLYKLFFCENINTLIMDYHIYSMNQIEYIPQVKSWWGNKSVILSDTDLLSTLKNYIIFELQNRGILNSNELDNRNLTPHVALVYSKKDIENKNEIYNEFIKKQIHINEHSLLIEQNLISVPLRPNSNIHFTVLFKRNIGNYRKQIIDIYKKWLCNNH